MSDSCFVYNEHPRTLLYCSTTSCPEPFAFSSDLLCSPSVSRVVPSNSSVDLYYFVRESPGMGGVFRVFTSSSVPSCSAPSSASSLPFPLAPFRGSGGSESSLSAVSSGSLHPPVFAFERLSLPCSVLYGPEPLRLGRCLWVWAILLARWSFVSPILSLGDAVGSFGAAAPAPLSRHLVRAFAFGVDSVVKTAFRVLESGS